MHQFGLNFKMKYFLLLLCISIGFGYKLPDGIKLCHKSQADFSECVAKNMRGGLEAFAFGNKEIGTPSIEPYFIEKLEIKPPASGKAVAVHLIFTNLNVYGMPHTDIVHMETDFDKGCSWIMDAVSPTIKLQGDFDMDGKLLVFPLNSHGKTNITIVGLRNRHSMWCEKINKNGKTFGHITKYTMDMHPENIIFEFTNLFPSNKDIEKEIIKTVNENSILLFNELKDAFERIFSTIHLQIANKVFSKIPMEEVFLP